MKAAADAFDLLLSSSCFTFQPVPVVLAVFPPLSKLSFTSFFPVPPTFMTTVTAFPAVACCALPPTLWPLFMSTLKVEVFFSSTFAVLSSWKNLSLDWSVLAAVAEGREVSAGLVLIDGITVVVVSREAVGLAEELDDAAQGAGDAEVDLGVVGFSDTREGLRLEDV